MPDSFFGLRVSYNRALTRVRYDGSWVCAGKRSRRDADYFLPAHWDSRLLRSHSAATPQWTTEGRPYRGSDGHDEPLGWMTLPHAGEGIVVGRTSLRCGIRQYGDWETGNTFQAITGLPAIIVAEQRKGSSLIKLVRLDPADVFFEATS